ncbi:MAG: zinc-ribbon domain containing protein [Chloroflexi bacterium]|nr:zinc-ribbon domain containing protein [Chloroflexota bacterium]
MTDKMLVCRDCGSEFAFTTGEQEFYSSRGLLNEPKRCPECRATRRREQQQKGGGFGSRQSFSATCAECGVETTVPFEPTEGRPVYCRECYNKVRQSEARS